MIITKCDKCGNLMHQADRCFACGNTINFTKVDFNLMIHENVKDKYENLEHLVKEKKYDEALVLSKLILEWMPSFSDVFWLRLLSKNHCNTDEELIRKGVSCEDSSDYYNAVVFANEVQRKVYTNVATKISDVKHVLTQYITEHEYSEKNNTSIIQIQLEYTSEIERCRKKLFQMWNELQQIESQMVALEKDCSLLINEHKETLYKSSSDSASIKAKAYKMEQCYENDIHEYTIQFGELIYQSEQAKNSIESIRRQHTWLETYDALLKKRDNLVSQINNEIISLKKYETKVQLTVSEIERIEARHAAALISITKYNFSEIRSLLGENRFSLAFVEAGVK